MAAPPPIAESAPALAPPRRSELPALARLAAAAMVDLPENRAVFRGRTDRLAAGFRVVLRHFPAELRVVRVDGEIAGWFRVVPWPACKPSDLAQLRLLPATLLALRGAAGRAGTMQDVWRKHDPPEPHLHLDPLVIARSQQGRGLGTHVMESLCARLDAEGTPGYLETGSDRNVRFYERFGYVVRSTATVLDVEMRFMWREPRRA